MNEPNVWLQDGEPVLVLAVVTDSHWKDKGLYKVKICGNLDGDSKEKYTEIWVHDRSLQEVPEA